MSNNITIELCAEDRERIDRLTEALERRACDKCVQAAIKYHHDLIAQTPKPAEPDPIQQKLAETLAEAEAPAEAPQEAAEATEAETPATTQADEEQPAAKADVAEAVPVVTVEDIRGRYVTLVASGKKEAARDTIMSYNVTKISDIPADKCAEVLAKLNALEG